MGDSSKYEGGESSDLAYDLRQRYAKIVGDHLEIMSINRQEKDYPAYFKSIQNLYIIVQHKFKEPKKKKKGEDEDITYETLINNVVEIANTHSNAWTNKDNSDADAIGKIENVLNLVEMFLYTKMDEAKMFGGLRDIEGLM